MLVLVFVHLLKIDGYHFYGNKRMYELSISEIEEVNGGLSPEAGAIAEGFMATAAFGLGMTGVGLIAVAAGLTCVALMK